MDRGAWQATVHWVTRVGHDLVTKPPPYIYTHIFSLMFQFRTIWNPLFTQEVRNSCRK